jgi:ribonuclease HI
MQKITTYTDGGARGNPGPAAIGAVIQYDNQEKCYSHFLGQTTNNEAEYQGLIFALKKIKALLGKKKIKKAKVQCFSDSELMVKQLNHQYKIEEENLQKLFIKIWNLTLDCNQIEFIYIPRERNRVADKLVNEELDKQENQKQLF